MNSIRPVGKTGQEQELLLLGRVSDNPGTWDALNARPAGGIIEEGVSVQQNGGMERAGNCRPATKTQRKLAPRRKVGTRAVTRSGCWLDG